MNVEEFYNYCIKKPFVEESFPFDKNTLVFKLKNKIFALCNIEEFSFINLKCNPEHAIHLREKYNGIQSAYHMNKKHWNSVYTNLDVPDQLIFDLIDHSYTLIAKALPKKDQFPL